MMEDRTRHAPDVTTNRVFCSVLPCQHRFCISWMKARVESMLHFSDQRMRHVKICATEDAPIDQSTDRVECFSSPSPSVSRMPVYHSLAGLVVTVADVRQLLVVARCE